MAHFINNSCIGCTGCKKVCPVSAIAGEAKNLHVINSDLCFDCGACGRSCHKESITDSDGLIVKKLKRAEWEQPVFDLKTCISCGACEDRCPVNCITIEWISAGGMDGIPRLEFPEKCVSCGWCSFYCPADCIIMKKPEQDSTKGAA